MSTMTSQELEYYGPDGLTYTDDAQSNVLFAKEFLKTSIGQQWKLHKLTTDDNFDMVIADAQKKAGRAEVNLKEVEASAREFFLNGDLVPKQEPVAQAPAPKQLSRSQLAWQEMREFTESHSVAECKARSSRDESYRKFLHTNLEREMNDTPVGDAMEPAGTMAVRRDKSIRITEDLRAFAYAYRRSSTAEVKRMSTPATNPFGHKQYTDLLDACIAAGLV